MDNKIIKGLAERLSTYASFDLNNSFPKLYDCPGLLQEDRNRLDTLDSFHGELELKKLVGELLQGSFENWTVNSWIVHQWGGIYRFDIGNHERITGFRNHLTEGSVTKNEFDRISSLSKIASFVSWNKFFIYDSRVAFSLNGFLLKMQQENPKLSIKFFPIPSAQGGRDKMMKRMIQQLYPDAIYLTKEETYTEYNRLILNLSKEIDLKKELPPCWIEMLLFALGKTGGKVEQMFDFSQIKAGVKDELKQGKSRNPQKKKASKKEQMDDTEDVASIKKGTFLRDKRVVLFGYRIKFAGKIYFLFVGEKKTFSYLELLTNKAGEKIEDCPLYHKLKDEGFIDKQGYDFIYQKLKKPCDEGDAKCRLDEILKRMTTDNNAIL